ncbi:hypothetical protein MTO96_033678 [Rhipicephalus appendiculatus]
MLVKLAFFTLLMFAVDGERDDDKLLARAHNQFALKLLKQLAHVKSPRPTSYFLRLASLLRSVWPTPVPGEARRSELGSVLGHTAVGLVDRARVLAAYKILLQQAASPDVTLDVANLVLIQRGFPVSESYQKQMRDVFDAELRSADFADAGSEAAVEVNAWVRNKTRGKISDILPEHQSLYIVLFLLNAVYFKGTWVTKFDIRRHRGQTLLQPGNHRDVVLRLPKFEISQRYNLVPAMEALGLNVVFGRSADFSRIVDGKRVHISDAVHQAAVEVNEEGTVAAAVTGLSIRPTLAVYIPPPPVLFTVDHPFLYYIRDKNSNRIFFFVGEVHSL